MSSAGAATQEVWRLFVAVDQPDDVRQRMEHIRDTLRHAGWKARWTNPESTHLTLKFFGNQLVNSIDELTGALRAAASGATPFNLRTGEMGAFPNNRRPRVIWLGVREPENRLTRLAMAIEEQSRSLGVEPDDRPFSPHLTVARVRPEDRESMTDIEAHFRSLNQLSELQFRADHVTLYRSELHRSGAIYTAVERIDFEA